MEQSISDIPSRSYGVEYFCCSEVMRSRLFLLLRSSSQKVFCEKDLRAATLLKKSLLRTPFLTERLWWLLLAIPSRLYRVEHFCYSEVIPSRTIRRSQKSYTEQKFSTLLFGIIFFKDVCWLIVIISKRVFPCFCVLP